jgi:tetratricopeptide (TPR) repeat protein
MKRRRSDAPLPHSPLEFASPLEVSGAGAEGAEILAEAGEPHAIHLMRALRLAHAWSRASRSGSLLLDHALLAAWEAELAPDRFDESFWAPLVILAAGVSQPGPGTGERIARSCLALSEWAIEQEYESTALLFAEAAALAWPTNARCAWTVGRMLRNRGHMRRAEAWLRRAERVAVWTGDSEVQDLALNSLGNLYAQQGAFVQAIEYLGRALNVARRSKRERRGAVTHDLFVVFILTGQHSRAEEMALAAFELYGPDHPNLPKLAHDVAGLWLRQGRYPIALPVLHALKPFLKLPQERLRVLASLARAGAAVNDRRTYESAWTEAWEIVHHPTPGVRAVLAATLVDLGYAAATLGDWEHAHQALSLALKTALERNAHEDAASAENGLEIVRNRAPVEHPRRPAFGPAVHLSNAFVRTLERTAPDVKVSKVIGKSTT